MCPTRSDPSSLLAKVAPEAPAGLGNDDALTTIYAGNKAGLRALHEALMARIAAFGAFGPAPNPRLKMLPPTSMCRASRRVESEAQIDDTLLDWLKISLDDAG